MAKKTINIDPKVHSQMKKFCDARGLKIASWLERLITEAVKKGEK